MNEQIKKLFTPVENGLPEEGKTVYLIGNSNRMFSGFYKKCKFWALNWSGEHLDEAEEVTHWLDLSTLCKKEAAIELAKDAWKEGFEYSYNEHFGKIPNPSLKGTDFISQNENRL
jgi:hypothetical protein